MRTQPSKPEGTPAVAVQGVVVPLATPEPVPREVATCPECGGTLTWQATTSDIIADMMLECEHEINNAEEGQDNYHRWWQSDWQPVIQKVKAWLEAKWHNVPDQQPRKK